jgi:SAM-dependent methyltransferase
MTRSSIPVDWFVCPVTKEPLSLREDGMFYSSSGRYGRDPRFGFWRFFPDDHQELSSPEWKTWEQLQQNGVISYQADPANNLGVGYRKDFADFAEFCQLRGNVLDVGVGPQVKPSHLEYSAGGDFFFVGIDPLEGDQPKSFEFIHGLGEYLPFRGELFDKVLFVTSLDHFIDPRAPLREAGRVVRSDGEVCVWLGEKDSDAPKPLVTHEWYEKLTVPSGAEDPFHFKRFSSTEFLGYVAEVGLSVVEHTIHEVSEWKRNHFYRLTGV